MYLLTWYYFNYLANFKSWSIVITRTNLFSMMIQKQMEQTLVIYGQILSILIATHPKMS